jgi:hypothetical protein
MMEPQPIYEASDEIRSRETPAREGRGDPLTGRILIRNQLFAAKSALLVLSHTVKLDGVNVDPDLLGCMR